MSEQLNARIYSPRFLQQQDRLSYLIQPLGSKTMVVELAGNITGEARDTMSEVYHKIEAMRLRNIIFDLSDCQNMYSPGIAVLLDIIIKTGCITEKQCLVVPNPHYFKLFKIMGFASFIHVCDSLEAAQAYLRATK